MPRNGSGSYNLPGGINPVLTQTLITSNWANTTMNDLAAAITQSLSKDGQTVPTANLPMGNFRHTGVGDPVLRNNYASLGYVQDGKDKRLTNVAGVNQITADLPGGATGAVVGQIIQLIPTSNNTGAVTLNINGTGFFPVVTDVGNPLGAGNLVAGRPYLLSFNGAQWFVISAAGGVSGFAQSAMTGWDRPTVNGPYPLITQVNPTTVAVPAGKGRIVHPSARDLSGVTEVSWSAQNVTLTNVAVAWATVLGVNAAGAIVQLTGTFNAAWARDYILLGSIAHINGQINEIVTRPSIYGDMSYAAYDIGTILNNTLVSGGKVLPNAASPFHVDLQAGSIFTLGGDSADVNGPNTYDFPATFDLLFFPVTGNNTVGAATQNVPVTQYDPLGAGAVTPIPGAVSTASIHRLFLLAGEFIFLYGQNIYADLITAMSQIAIDDGSLVPPSRLVNATLLCYIVAQKNCTDLKNAATARIVPKGGSSFSIGTAGSISEAPINGLIYGRINAAWAETIPAPVGPQATLRQIYYYTNTFRRFSEGLNDTAEGGANSGSNWELRAYNDAGSLLGTVMTVNRATQIATFSGYVVANQSFRSSTAQVVLAPVGINGDISFRPNGDGSLLGAAGIDKFGILYVSPVNASGYPGINVYQDGKYTSPWTSGNAGGIGITALDTAVDAGCSITFRGSDSPTTERPGAVIQFGKDGPWASGGGDYPGFLAFNTRQTAAGGGQSPERLRIDSAGRSTFTPNNALGDQGLYVVQDGVYALAATGQMGGIALVSADTTANAAIGITLRARDTTGISRHGGILAFVKDGPWVGGGGDYPGAWAFFTRQTLAAGGNEIERMRINSAGLVFAQGIIQSGTEVRTNVNFASVTAAVVLAPNGPGGSIFLQPNGVGSGAGSFNISSTGAVTVNGNMVMTPAVLTVAPITITGAFTAAGRQVLMTNTDTSTGSLFGFVLKAGTGIGSTISDYAPEYNGLVMFTGKLGIEGPNNGIAYSALGAAGTHTWYQGAARTLMMTLGTAGLSLATATGIGFYGTAATTKKTVTGAKGGNAALASLLTALVAYGLITDTTTA